MTCTIFTKRRGCSVYPAYQDTHRSAAIEGMLEHYEGEVAAGRLESVQVVDDGASRADSARALDAESRAADASEAHLRAIGA